MGWHYSNGGGAGYSWSGLNTYNQHCALISGLTPGTAIIKLYVKAAGYSGAVATRLVAWGPSGGSVVAQSSSFTMADGNESTQYNYERSVSYHVMSGSSVWVGLYRNPSGSHIMETDSGSGDGYRKTNTSSFPNVSSMSGYNTDSNDEPYVGVFMIAEPNDPTSASVTRVSDTSQTVEWTRNASSDRPVYTQYVERWDNVSGNWYVKKTITTDYTSNGSHSWTDTTTVANRQYRYRIRAYNYAGYSSYEYTSYIHTTPAKPTNVVATRDGSNVVITWEDNSYQEDLFRIQSRESTDGGETWGSWGDVDTVGVGNVEYTDTSPYTYGQYRVQAEEGTYNSPTLLSGYTESNEVATLATPDAPSGLNPDSSFFDADNDKIFYWNHNPTDGTAQTKYSLQYRIVGAGSWTTYADEVANTNEYVTIPSSTFVNGEDYEWQVKTWGTYATGSDWSSEAYFTTVTTPEATITDPTAVSNYGYSTLELDWDFTQTEDYDQIVYLAKLYDENDTLLETNQVSSVIGNGESDTCTFDYILENETDYKVTLQVQEENGLWSEEYEVEFTTEFLQPTKPTFELSLNEDQGSIDIDISNPEVIVDYNEESTQDTYIDSDNSGTNYNDNGQLQLEGTVVPGTRKYILLDFDLSFFIGKTIVSANLQLYRKTALVAGIDSTVNYIKTSFDETSVTWGTIPTLDSTDYDDHTHSAGDSETWDLQSLLQDIADENITDYEGLAIVPTTTDGSVDEFYDSTITGLEPVLVIEIGPLNADTDYNRVYRSINGGNWELVQDEVPINTGITDYIPSIGGNNNYYVQAVSDTPSVNNSDEEDLDVLLTGMFFINGGDGFSNVVRLVGDITLSETINRDEVIKQYKGRTYPIKYQGYNINDNFVFSADCPNSKKSDLIYILEYVGDIFYRDWRNNWFYAMLSNSKFDIKDPQAYQFNTNITRLNGGVE